MKLTALYPRVSTQEQAKEGYSIDEQSERLQAFCRAKGWTHTKLYVDAGYSGANTNRPALQAMIADIQKGKIERVVVYRLDRLSRSQKDTLNLIEDVFIQNGVDFVSLNENFDTSTAFGKAMVGILAVFAQLEREQIKERMSMGKEGRAKEGKWKGGGYIPVGYDYTDGHLVINPYEAMQVKEIFSKYISGSSIRSIEKEMLESGFRHKYGEWIAKTITSVLENPIYVGKLRNKGTTYEAEHAPIIDEEVFQQAQELNAIRRQSGHAQRTSKRPLQGIIYCGQCGAKYGVTSTKNHGITYIYYECYSRRKCNRRMIKNPDCKNRTWRAEELEGIIIDEMKKLQLDPEGIVRNRKPEQESKTEEIEKRIQELDIKISRFLDLYGAARIGLEQVSDKITSTEAEKTLLEAKLKALQADEKQLQPERATELISTISQIIDRGNQHEIKRLVQSLIEKVVIDGERIRIEWRF